jgi:acetoacetyl-CoA synthetase
LPEGWVLWKPDPANIDATNISSYFDWLRERGRDFVDYDSAWRWSVDDLEAFWKTIWDYFDVKARNDPVRILEARKMPGAKWFAGAELNFAEHFFRQRRDGLALVHKSENDRKEIPWTRLAAQVSSVAASLRRMGIRKGESGGIPFEQARDRCGDAGDCESRRCLVELFP